MRLTVNGVPVRVIDRIEIVLEVPDDGDTLLNGVVVDVKGGPLTVYQGDSAKDAAVWIGHDSQLTLVNKRDDLSLTVHHQNLRTPSRQSPP
ncbi:MAG TPA: hypothetical protein VKQ71_03540 [Acidimicrobiales bacterium]|nr:hypothetical protein [Acidimicrobiales bacterium]